MVSTEFDALWVRMVCTHKDTMFFARQIQIDVPQDSTGIYYLYLCRTASLVKILGYACLLWAAAEGWRSCFLGSSPSGASRLSYGVQIAFALPSPWLVGLLEEPFAQWLLLSAKLVFQHTNPQGSDSKREGLKFTKTGRDYRWEVLKFVKLG